jgi:hypothetical protein
VTFQAGKFRRPALHDYISGPMVNSLASLLKRAKPKNPWVDEVEQIRLEVMSGTRLSPQRVRLWVVTDVVFDPDMRNPLREEWKSHRKALRTHHIDQAPIAFRTIETMSVREYRASVPVNLPTLGRGTF